MGRPLREKPEREDLTRTGNYRVEDDGERGTRRGRRGDVFGQVVVVLDGFEADGLAVEA